MAKLYRGVLGLPYRAALIALAFGFASTGARAQEEISVDDIVGWAADLRSDDGAARRRAYERLSHLPESALPAIAERIEQTRRQIVPPEDGREALRAFRHAVGSRRADDMVDIAPGILPVLEERRTREVGRTAERLLLLRSLEAIGTVEAQRRIADLFSLTNEMWRWEQRRVVHRMGVRLLPGLILARGHRDRGVRLWARGHIRNLGMKDPANALRVEDPELLAQIIDAYAEVKDLDTMPLILSYVGHEDRRIREAARAAFESFGRNGIWQLREGIRKQLGRTPDPRWGWRRTMRELFEGLDERRLAPYARRLDEAQAALRAGHHEEAKALLDALLRDAPRPPRAAEVAAAYAELATNLDDPQLLRRAVWLAPDAPQAPAWRARLSLLEAEADRARGVVDAEAYRVALERDPSPRTRALAAEVLGDGEARAVEAVETKEGGPTWLLAFVMLIAAAAAGLAFRRHGGARVSEVWHRLAASWRQTVAAGLRGRAKAAGRVRRTLRRDGGARTAPTSPPGRSTSLGELLRSAATRARRRADVATAGDERGDVSAPAPLSLTQLVLDASAAGTTLRAPPPAALEQDAPDDAAAAEGAATTRTASPDDENTQPGLEPLLASDEADPATEPGMPPAHASAEAGAEAPARQETAMGLAALLLAAPADSDTLPGAPAPR